MNQYKQFFGDTTIYGFGNAIKKLIGFLLLPFYTRALTPDDYGVIEILGVSAMLFIIILNIGISTSCSRYFYTAKSQDEKGKVLFTTFVLRLLSIIPIIPLSFFSELISLNLFGSVEYTWFVFIT